MARVRWCEQNSCCYALSSSAVGKWDLQNLHWEPRRYSSALVGSGSANETAMNRRWLESCRESVHQKCSASRKS